MAQGKKYDDEIKEQARAMLAINDNVLQVAKALSLPESTIRSWKKSFEREDGGQNLAKLRERKKGQFVRKAWANIDRLQALISKKLKRAEKSEEELDKLLEIVASLPDGELPAKEKKVLAAKLAALKLEDIGKLSTVLGTLYDKQALASNDVTEVVSGTIGVAKFEDFE